MAAILSRLHCVNVKIFAQDTRRHVAIYTKAQHVTWSSDVFCFIIENKLIDKRRYFDRIRNSIKSCSVLAVNPVRLNVITFGQM